MRAVFCAIVLSVGVVTIGSAQPESANEDFATAKANHVARLEKELTCVQASSSFESMRACMPGPAGGHRGPPPSSSSQ